MATFEDWFNGEVSEDINELYFEGKLSIDEHTEIMTFLMNAVAQEIDSQVEQLKQNSNVIAQDKTLLLKEFNTMRRMLLDETNLYKEKYAKIKNNKLTLYPSTDLPVIMKTKNGLEYPKNSKVYNYMRIKILTSYFEWLSEKIEKISV